MQRRTERSADTRKGREEALMDREGNEEGSRKRGEEGNREGNEEGSRKRGEEGSRKRGEEGSKRRDRNVRAWPAP